MVAINSRLAPHQVDQLRRSCSEVITPDDPQMLEDLVMAAVNEALRKARELVAGEMSRVAGGLPGKIPGLM